jgi:hypothetical protein
MSSKPKKDAAPTTMHSAKQTDKTQTSSFRSVVLILAVCICSTLALSCTGNVDREISLAVSACLLMATYHYVTMRNIRASLLTSLLLLPATYLAIEGTTQFLTCDETYMIRELENTRIFNYRQWNMDGYRTSILITGTLTGILKKLILSSDAPEILLHGLAKSLHWLVGFGILLMIHEALRRFFVPKERQPIFFGLFFALALMMPTNILAFKVANYDLLSMMLGILSLVLALGALSTRNLPTALGAIIAGTLASQEKIIASPFLAFATFAAVFLAATWPARLIPTRKEPSKRRTNKFSQGNAVSSEDFDIRTPFLKVPWGHVTSASLAVFASMLLPVFLTWAIVNGIHGGLKFSFAKAVTPLTGYLSVASENTSSASTMFWTVNLGIVIVAVLSSTVFRFFRDKVGSPISSARFTAIAPLVILAFVILGMIGTYSYTAYVHPYHSTPQGMYLPTRAFNDAVTHYMQPTFAAHLKAGVAMSYSAIANGLPTALCFLLAIASFIGFVRPRLMNVPLAWSCVAVFVLVFPMAYAVTQTPFGTRYLNIFLFVIVIYGVFIATGIIAALNGMARIAAAVMFSMLVAVELLMFRPIIGSFTPIWNKVESEFAAKPLYGQSRSGFWAGWGEENFIAGRIIADKFRQPGESIRIHCSYPGDWLINDTTIRIIPFNEITRGISTSDYYIMSRQAIYQKRYPFPWGIKPLFTLDYGGATMAWVFRGDQLRNNLLFALQEKGGGYIAELPELKEHANNESSLNRSRLVVYEDGKPLGPPHSPFDEIRKAGKGRYNHWKDIIFFTASDNSDPRSNSRTYSVSFTSHDSISSDSK